MRPHSVQLFTNWCFWPRHSQGCLPGRRTELRACPSAPYSGTNRAGFFFGSFPEPVIRLVSSFLRGGFTTTLNSPEHFWEYEKSASHVFTTLENSIRISRCSLLWGSRKLRRHDSSSLAVFIDKIFPVTWSSSSVIFSNSWIHHAFTSVDTAAIFEF